MKLSQNKKTGKITNVWRLDRIYQNYQCVKGEIKKLKCILKNENKDRTYQKSHDAIKAVLTGKFVEMNSHMRKNKACKQSNFIPQGCTK
jgi:hypothetical protein